MSSQVIDMICAELAKLKAGEIILAKDASYMFDASEEETKKALLKAAEMNLVEVVFCLRGLGHYDWTPHLLSLRREYTSFRGEPLSGAEPRNVMVAFRRI